MKVNVKMWIDLPFYFKSSNEFKKPCLDKFDFTINEIKINLLKDDENIIKKIKIESEFEYDNNYYPSYKNHTYLSEFYDKVIFIFGKTVQNFLDGFSRALDRERYIIFNGDDFTTTYSIQTNPDDIIGSCSYPNENKITYFLDNKNLHKTIKFANEDDNIYKTAWYILKDAETSLDMGKYESAIINMAIMAEFLITSQLNEFLYDNGYFKYPHNINIEKKYGLYPSFVEKYYEYGLKLFTNKCLDKDDLDILKFIYKVRNKLAHGKKLYEIDIIKENKIVEENIKELLEFYFITFENIYWFFSDLNIK